MTISLKNESQAVCRIPCPVLPLIPFIIECECLSSALSLECGCALHASGIHDGVLKTPASLTSSKPHCTRPTHARRVAADADEQPRKYT